MGGIFYRKGFEQYPRQNCHKNSQKLTKKIAVTFQIQSLYDEGIILDFAKSSWNTRLLWFLIVDVEVMFKGQYR